MLDNRSSLRHTLVWNLDKRGNMKNNTDTQFEDLDLLREVEMHTKIYQFRELKETAWKDCCEAWYEACQPEHEVRILYTDRVDTEIFNALIDKIISCSRKIESGIISELRGELLKAKKCLKVDDIFKVEDSWIGSVQNYIAYLEHRLKQHNIDIYDDMEG